MLMFRQMTPESGQKEKVSCRVWLGQGDGGETCGAPLLLPGGLMWDPRHRQQGALRLVSSPGETMLQSWPDETDPLIQIF